MDEQLISQEARRRARWFAYFPALVTAIGVLLVAIYVDRVNRERFVNDLRLSVFDRLSVARARLEGNVTANAQLVRGLVAVIATEPDMTQERFARVAAELFRGKSQIRNIGAAPDLVIRLMYPLAGNEGAVGLDYRKVPAQKAAALKARELGELVLAGPVHLVQGGQGFIGRIPVFVDHGPERERTFWGLVSTVIDVDMLYRDSGLLDPDLPIEIAIKGKNALGAGGARFFGRETVFTDDPVEVDVSLPWGSWHMAAIPKGGWPTRPDNAFGLYAAFVLAGLLIVVPMVVVGRLIAERQEAEERLTRTVEALAASNTELERFAYVAAHDLQEPLRNIISYSQILERRLEAKVDDDEREFMGYVLEGAQRMRALVRDLLAYSRVTRSAEPFRPFDAGLAVETAKSNLSETIRESAAEVVVETLPTVSGDQVQVSMVFQNLIGNAIKYRRDTVPPHIEIGAMQRGPFWEFAVKDNGQGIEREHHEKIYEVFRRLHSHVDYPGSGIGLSICKRIVERHRGRIWVVSQPGVGSTFHFTLPAPAEE